MRLLSLTEIKKKGTDVLVMDFDMRFLRSNCSVNTAVSGGLVVYLILFLSLFHLIVRIL